METQVWAVRLEELEKRLDLRFVSEKEAREIAKQEIDRRLEGMNEFRTQLTKQASEFATKAQVEADRDRLSEVTSEKEKGLAAVNESRDKRITSLERFRDTYRGQLSMVVLGLVVLQILMKIFWK